MVPPGSHSFNLQFLMEEKLETVDIYCAWWNSEEPSLIWRRYGFAVQPGFMRDKSKFDCWSWRLKWLRPNVKLNYWNIRQEERWEGKRCEWKKIPWQTPLNIWDPLVSRTLLLEVKCNNVVRNIFFLGLIVFLEVFGNKESDLACSEFDFSRG